MNTANVTANSINVAAAAAAVASPQTSTIMKTSQPASQQTQILQPTSIIPTTIISTNERLNAQNANPSNTASGGHNNNNNSGISQQSIPTTHQNHDSVQPSVTAFTIHAPTAASAIQTIPNNLVNSAVTSGAAGQAQTIQAINTNTSVIHPATIGLSTSNVASSVVSVATILPSGSAGQQQVIPVGVSALKAQPTAVTTIPIGPRFQANNVMASTGPPSSGPINALFIHQQQPDHNVNKNPNIAHATANHHPHVATVQQQQQQQQPQQHLQQNSVINSITNVSVAGPISTHHNQATPAAPLFVQTCNSQSISSAIFHQTGNIAQIGHNLSSSAAPNSSSSSGQQPTTIAAVTLTTSSGQQQQQQQQQPQFQRLKVEDALSYLDLVKIKFNDKPQVYNDFLDIMKEFKSQSIDTPGVIQRVSNLFKGHPQLIVGFNTFLPPGYKIELHANDQVNVSMPNSANVVLMSSATMPTPPLTPHQQQQQQQPSSSVAVATTAIVTGPNIHPISSNLVRNSATALVSNQNVHHQQAAVNTNHHGQSQSSPIVNSITLRETASTISSMNSNGGCVSGGTSLNRIDTSSHNHRSTSSSSSSTTTTNIVGHSLDNTSMASSGLNSSASAINHTGHLSNPNSIVSQSGPVEFNHAISYVNKIKNRCQPEIYRQFLDILQSYQKEQDNSGQKILTESEVFSKVSQLFENQPDLLQEFSQFLPDAHNSNCHVHHNSGLGSPHVPNNLLNSSVVNYSNQNSISASNYTRDHQHMDGSGTNFLQSPNSMVNVNEFNPLKATMNALNTLNNKAILSNRMSSNSNLNTNNSSSANNINNNSQLNSSFSNAFHRPNKRSISQNNHNDQNNSQYNSMKRSRISLFRESNMPEVNYHGDLVEYAFFDKLRMTLNVANYEWLLRCATLFTNEILTRTEFAQMVQPLFASCQDLFRRFKEMLGIKEGSIGNSVNNNQSHIYMDLYNHNSYPNALGNVTSYHANSYQFNNSLGQLEGHLYRLNMSRDRHENEYIEPDFASCRRYGVSYRTIPKSSSKQECSGRTKLCREVLNDKLVSFPSWSEDSTFVSSRKTQFEEFIYRSEDERYEMDLVIETNLSTIRVLDAVQKKLENMLPEEKNNFKLDDCLGGTSQTIHVNSIRRIYGELAGAVIEGIKNSPANVIPLVLRRLISKDEEWREAQKEFNRMWREQNEKYYLKSLDHQGGNFKTNDKKYIHQKALLSEIESIVQERTKPDSKPEQQQQQQDDQTSSKEKQPSSDKIDTKKKKEEDVDDEDDEKKEKGAKNGPHMTLFYPDKAMIDVACNLIIHHVKRQSPQDEKRKIKQLMRQFIPDLFATPRGALSDDESSNEDSSNNENDLSRSTLIKLNKKTETKQSIFYANSNWYLFFRLHQILCERLGKMHEKARELAAEELKNYRSYKKNCPPAVCLGFSKDACIENYFDDMIDKVKQLLDGNLDANQYEDGLREKFSIHAYLAFTFDKIVQNIVKELQSLVTDEVSQQCKELFMEAQDIGLFCVDESGNPIIDDSEKFSYFKKFESICDEEKCYKIVIFQKEGKITIDMVECKPNEENGGSNEDEDDSEVPRSSRTLRSSTKNMSEKERSKYLNLKFKEMMGKHLRMHPLFLRKIIRKHKKFNQSNNQYQSSDGSSSSNSNDDENDTNDETNDDNGDNNNDNDENEMEENENEEKENNENDENDEKDEDDKENESDPETSTVINTTTEENIKEEPDNNENDGNDQEMENAEEKDVQKDDDGDEDSSKNDNKKCEFNLNRYKSICVVQNEMLMYKMNERPKKDLKNICQIRYKRFNEFHSKWLETNCTELVKDRYDKWLLETDTTEFKLNDDEENEEEDEEGGEEEEEDEDEDEEDDEEEDEENDEGEGEEEEEEEDEEEEEKQDLNCGHENGAKNKDDNSINNDNDSNHGSNPDKNDGDENDKNSENSDSRKQPKSKDVDAVVEDGSNNDVKDDVDDDDDDDKDKKDEENSNKSEPKPSSESSALSSHETPLENHTESQIEIKDEQEDDGDEQQQQQRSNNNDNPDDKKSVHKIPMECETVAPYRTYYKYLFKSC